MVEMNDEQTELVNGQVKQAVNVIFQRLKARIQPTKQYTGEQVLTRSLEIIKKATLKVLSNNEDEQSSEEVQSENDNENDDQPTNGNSVDQQTLNEEVSSVRVETRNSSESETLTANNTKNGWDTVDDLQQEAKEQTQVVVPTEESTLTGNETDKTEENEVIKPAEDSTSAVNETETTSNPIVETNEPVAPSKPAGEDAYDGDTVDENPKPSETTAVVSPAKDGK